MLTPRKASKNCFGVSNHCYNLINERIKQIEAKIKNPEKLRLGLEKFSNSLNSLINRLEKGDLVSLRLFASQGASEKDILVRNMVSNLEIDAQKRVIYRYKSPFNFIFELEFSTGSPVGEGRVDIVARLCMVVDWCIDHPEYTAKIKVIPKKDYPILMPCEF